jgi:hypothetical protein
MSLIYMCKCNFSAWWGLQAIVYLACITVALRKWSILARKRISEASLGREYAICHAYKSHFNSAKVLVRWCAKSFFIRRITLRLVIYSKQFTLHILYFTAAHNAHKSLEIYLPGHRSSLHPPEQYVMAPCMRANVHLMAASKQLLMLALVIST